MRKSNTFFQVGYMYMQGALRGAACALLMMIWLGLGSAWADTFTIDCTTSSSDALFSVSGNGTQYDYDSRWTSLQSYQDG